MSKVLSACCDNGCSMSDLEQTWSDWAPIVRSQFGGIVRTSLPIIEDSLKNAPPDFCDLDGNAFKAPPREGDKNVSDTLPRFSGERQETNLRITTIHSVKGETLDAVLLVSAPNKQGTQDGHWTQWLEDPTSEAARLAYVASSRPKHLLAWAIPKTHNEDDLNKIRGLGFHIIDMSTSLSSSQ